MKSWGLKKTLLASAISVSVLMMTGCGSNDESTTSPTENTQTVLYQAMEQYQKDNQSLDPYGFGIDDSAMAKKADLAQELLTRISTLDRNGLNEQDQIFLDMFVFDLETELMGYKVGGLERNVISQIPITHFRNYVESGLGYAFDTKKLAAVSYRSGQSFSAKDVSEPGRIDNYFSGFTNQENDRDLAHIQSHIKPATKNNLARAVFYSASADTDPLSFYRNKETYNKAFLAYVKEVKHQFEKGVEDHNTLADILVSRLVAQFDAHITDDGKVLRELTNVTTALDQITADSEEDQQFKTDYLKLMESISTAVVDLRDYLNSNYAAKTFDDPEQGRIDSSIPHGWAGMADGKDWYNWLLRTHSTTDRTADEIHNTGLEEVSRVFGEMVEVCHNVGKCSSDDASLARKSGEIYKFFDYLNQQQYFYLNPHPAGYGVVEGDQHSKSWWNMWAGGSNPNKLDADHYPDLAEFPADNFDAVKGELNDEQLAGYQEHRRSLKEYNAFKKNIKDNKVLEGWFAEKTIPTLDYRIVPTDFANGPYSGVASYNTYGTPEGAEGEFGGQFNLNTYYPYGLQSWNISTLLTHEAAPGHHFQLIIAKQLAEQNPDWPDYIKNSHNTAYVEGWALYTEDLAKTHLEVYKGKGLYNPNEGDITDDGSKNPEGKASGAFLNELQKFGQLNEEMLRSMRLVVDTGLHAKGWSHNYAVTYMKNNSALGDGDVSSEVPRYMAYTGQAVSYKTGSLTLLDLRKELADHLSVTETNIPVDIMKEFHHKVLEHGALPMGVLQAKIRRWIESV